MAVNDFGRNNVAPAFKRARAPGATDDSSMGVALCSIWINSTNDNVFICTDTTAGAAVWAQIAGGGGGITGLTPNFLPKALTPTTIGDSAVSDTTAGSGDVAVVVTEIAGNISTAPGVTLTSPVGNVTFSVAPTGTATGFGSIDLQSYLSGSNTAAVNFTQANGTPNVPTATMAEDYIGAMFFDSFDGVNYNFAGQFYVQAISDGGAQCWAFMQGNGTPFIVDNYGNLQAGNPTAYITGTVAPETAIGGAVTQNGPNGTVTSEGLVAQTLYTLTLTNANIQAGSTVLIDCVANDGTTIVNLLSKTITGGQIVVEVAMTPAFTGSLTFSQSIFN